jgi:two-component system LytT family response regulator
MNSSRPAPNGHIPALIVDDEPLARRGIKALLKQFRAVEVIGECGDGLAAVEEIRTKKPALVFLDIQMPGLTGFEVIQKVGPAAMPVTIFVTAFDAHALQAFEVHAIDYLLKPINRDRFGAALERACAMIESRNVDDLHRKLDNLLAQRNAGAGYIRRLFVKHKDQVDIIPVDRIDWIEARDDYLCVVAEGKKHLVRERISDLGQQLDPSHFVRIHRSFIVRINRIKGLKPLFSGDQLVVLADNTELPMSRTYGKKVLALLRNIS